MEETFDDNFVIDHFKGLLGQTWSSLMLCISSLYLVHLLTACWMVQSLISSNAKRRCQDPSLNLKLCFEQHMDSMDTNDTVFF